MDQRFAGRSVIVTGGSSGIGRATAVAFAKEGAWVAAWGRDPDRLAAVEADGAGISGGGRITTSAVELRDLTKVRAEIAEIVRARGRLDVLVNCAGIGPEQPILEVTEDTWREVLDVNLTAGFFAAQEAARHMVRIGGGAIVNVASTDAFVHDAPFVHYSVSKAGVVMMTRAFAYELGHLGVRCNAVAPGATLTPMTEEALSAAGHDPAGFEAAGVETARVEAAAATREGLRRVPLGRFARPEEQAAAILFLASDEASYINGTTLLVDGGMLQGYWYAPHRVPGPYDGQTDAGARPPLIPPKD